MAPEGRDVIESVSFSGLGNLGTVATASDYRAPPAAVPMLGIVVGRRGPAGTPTIVPDGTRPLPSSAGLTRTMPGIATSGSSCLQQVPPGTPSAWALAPTPAACTLGKTCELAPPSVQARSGSGSVPTREISFAAWRY